MSGFLFWKLNNNGPASFYKLSYKDDEVTSPTFIYYKSN